MRHFFKERKKEKMEDVNFFMLRLIKVSKMNPTVIVDINQTHYYLVLIYEIHKFSVFIYMVSNKSKMPFFGNVAKQQNDCNVKYRTKLLVDRSR